MFSMQHFTKLPSIVQILFAEFLMTIFLGGLSPYLYRAIWPRRLSYTPPPLDGADFAFGAIGVALLIWLMWGPLFPRIAGVSWTPVFKSGNLDAVAVMPSATVDYGFPTSHPSYVFIDLLIVGFWWFFRVVMGDGDPERVYEANCWVAVASIVPVWRLICWYILRRRPPPGTEAAVQDAWKPVANLYVWFMLPLFAVFALVYAFG